MAGKNLLTFGKQKGHVFFIQKKHNPGFSLGPELQVVGSWTEIPKSQREMIKGQNYLVIMERYG